MDLVPVGRRQIIESIEDPVVTLDGRNRVIDSNPAALEIADVTEDWEGAPVEKFFGSFPELVRAIESGSSREVALTDGNQTRHVALRISPVRGEDTTLGLSNDVGTGTVVVMRDITKQVRRQKEVEKTNEELESRNKQLDRARERYRTLFEKSPLALWEEDISEAVNRAKELVGSPEELPEYLESNPEEHRELFKMVEVLDVNETAVEAYQRSSKEELIENVDDRLTDEALQTNRRLLRRLLEGGTNFSEETVYRTADGDRRHVLLNVFVLEEDYSRVLVAETDITEREERRKELERYETFIENSSDVITHLSEHGEMLYQSSGTERLFGHEPEINLSENVFEFVHPDDRERVMAGFAECIGDPETDVVSLEFRLEATDGEYVWVEAAGTDQRDTDVGGLVVSIRDISERKERENTIEAQNRRLERLAGVISHDLQTPLSTAEKHLQLLRIELEDPDEMVEESIDHIETTHERLRRLTEHLPRLARESTDVESPVKCSVGGVARDAWQVTETEDLELAVEGGCMIEADPSRLQQMFENLFSNVVEHATGGGSGATTVRVEIEEDGFAVEDDGPGMGEEQKDEVFEYGMSTADGSGAGLAIVRSIVEAHGWSVTVEESESGGARFVVTTAGNP